MKPSTVADWQWERLSALIADRMGLRFPPERWGDLQRGLAGAAQELGLPGADSYVRQLLGAPPDSAELQRLARHLTIGETYFFRDAQLLQAFSREILPELIAARRGRSQRLRIWSAGCASGEEAYSLAILLHQAVPDLAAWTVTITATDINPAALHKAVAGVYGEWSFRNVAPGLKEAYFDRRADGRYAIKPHIRSLVNFEYLNLVEDAYPSLPTDTNAMDVVFCRNVLMYFTPAQMARVIGRLHQSLAEGGWLAVSPSETSQALFAQFATVNFPGAIVYRKRAAAARAPARNDAQRAVAVPPAAVPAAPVPLSPVPPDFAAVARRLANEGQLPQALAWCDRWLAADKVDPAAHYLRAIVLLEQGDWDEARTALRRATFLAPGFVLAHFALANLARRQGRGAEAARHFTNTARLLAQHDPADLLPEGEGLSAGSLAQTIAAISDAQEAA